MKPLDFWKTRLIRQKRQPVTPSRPGKAIAPKPFESLPREQSRALLLVSLYWLEYEAWGILAMTDGPAKEQLRAELRGRHRAMLREYERLLGSEG